MNVPLEALDRLCRICGGSTSKYRLSYLAVDHKESLQITFSTDVPSQSFCNRCYAVKNRKVNANKQNKVYLHSVEVFQWFPHDDDSCMTCNT